MKKSTRYGIILSGIIYIVFVIASIFIAFRANLQPKIYGTGIIVWLKRGLNGILFLIGMLPFLASTVMAAAHLFGRSKLPWAFLWAFLLYCFIGLWSLIPVACYAYLYHYKRA